MCIEVWWRFRCKRSVRALSHASCCDAYMHGRMAEGLSCTFSQYANLDGCIYQHLSLNRVLVCLQVHADQHQHSHSHAEPHRHEEHSHSHHEEHSETHTHSEHSTSHTSHSDSHSGHSESHSHSHDHHDHDHNHPDHVHDDSVSSVSLMLEGSMDLNRVNMFLGGLLELDAENMYRYKGLLAVAGADERFVFQVSPFLHSAYTMTCSSRCHRVGDLLPK